MIAIWLLCISHTSRREDIDRDEICLVEKCTETYLLDIEFADIELIDWVTKLLELGKIPFNFYIDLSKAFDVLNNDILLSKLEFYGLSEFTIKLIKNYHSNRSQFCQYYDVSSDVVRTNIGIPQGFILGALLFSIYINDIVNTSDKLSFLMYADDTTLIGSVEDFLSNESNESTEDIITEEFIKITTWMEVNKLLINENKNKIMFFYCICHQNASMLLLLEWKE